MGIIQSQSFYSAIFSYIGVALGFLSSAIILPQFLLPEQVGFFKLIVAVIGVFSTIFSLGISQLLFRSFPKFKDDKLKRRRLLRLALLVAALGSILALPVFFYFSESLFNFERTVEGVDKNFNLLVFIFTAIVAQILYSSIYGYVRMLNNIVIDSFIQNVFLKGGVLVLLILYYVTFIDFSGLIYLQLILFMMFPVLITVIFYFKKDSMSLSLLRQSKGEKSSFNTGEKKEFVRLLLFGLLTTLGGSLYLYLDTLMVNHFLSEKEVGIYGTMYLFGMIVIIPARSLKSISVSILAQSFNENDYDNINDVYKKSSITLLIIGGFIFLAVWCNIYSVLKFLPDEYALGSYVVLFIGLGQLVDMAMGVNNELIAASPKYKLNTLFTICSIFLGIFLNVILIPMYGVNGAGVATLLTITSVNIFRLIAVLKLYSMNPFSFNTIKVISIIIVLNVIVSNIPDLENYIVNLLMKGTIITVIYLPVIYFLRVSEDINKVIDKFISRFHF